MDLSFKKVLYKIDVYGKEQQLRKPYGPEKQEVLFALNEIDNDKASGKKMKGNEDFIIFKNFVEKMGMEKDLFDTMYEEDQVELCSFLLNVKKN